MSRFLTEALLPDVKSVARGSAGACQRREPDTIRSTALAPAPRAVSHRSGCRAFVLVAKADPAFCQIVRRHLDGDAVADQHADVVLLHLARRVGQRLVPVVEVDAEASFGQALQNGPVELDEVFLGHSTLQSGGGRRPAPQLLLLAQVDGRGLALLA